MQKERMVIDGDLCHNKIINKTTPKLTYNENVNFEEWKKELKAKFVELIGLDLIQANACELNMTIEEALSFFSNIPLIRNRLQTLNDVGLGYVKLGQSSTTLSGGEAQRVKLASELYKKITNKTVFVLDEPTTGLHTDDVKRLLEVLNHMVDQGATVIVIEHNLDVIKQADYIIDLGPEGGYKGGTIVATGTPEEVSQSENSYTGQFLKKVL